MNAYAAEFRSTVSAPTDVDSDEDDDNVDLASCHINRHLTGTRVRLPLSSPLVPIVFTEKDVSDDVVMNKVSASQAIL
jgi:hypothetical protein